MRPPRSLAPAAAALLALTVALASAAAARHPYATVPPPAERADAEVRRMYAAWKSEHGRQRAPAGNCDLAGGEEEDRLRLEVFRDNLRYIDAHNAEADAGLHTFRLGLTPFADLTVEEYRGRVLGFRGRRGAARRAGSTRYPRRHGDQLPDAVDWRLLGAVTEVKNQEQCGPCSAPCCSLMLYLITSPTK